MSDRRITEFFAEFEPPEGVRAELLRGEIVLTVSPDLVHNRIVAEVQDQIPRQGWRRLQTQRVAIAEEPSEPQPDLVVIERGAGPDGGRLMPAEVITLLVEVVSTNSVHRDYSVKRSIYAAANVGHRRIRHLRERHASPPTVTKSINSSTRPSSSGSRSL